MKHLIKKLGMMPPNVLTPIVLAQYFQEQKYACIKGEELAGLKAVGGSKAWLGHTKTGSAYKNDVPTGAMYKTLKKFLEEFYE